MADDPTLQKRPDRDMPGDGEPFGVPPVVSLAQRIERLTVSGPPGHALALALAAVSVVGRVLLTPFIGDTTPFITFIPTVIAGALVLGPRALVTMVVAMLGGAGVLLMPAGAGPGRIAVLFLVLMTGMAVLILAVRTMREALLKAMQAKREADLWRTAAERTLADLREQRAEADLLSRELNHRVKNLFAVILSIVRMSGRQGGDVEDVISDLCARVEALAAAHAVTLDKTADAPLDLRDLLTAALGNHVVAMRAQDAAGTSRPALVLDGPQVTLPVRAVTPIGLLVHELATNAAKYGGLAMPGGQVVLRWRVTRPAGGDALLRMDWAESGAPPRPGATMVRRGFGTTLIDTAIRQLSGDIQRDWSGGGLSLAITVPLTDAMVAGTADHAGLPVSPPPAPHPGPNPIEECTR